MKINFIFDGSVVHDEISDKTRRSYRIAIVVFFAIITAISIRGSIVSGFPQLGYFLAFGFIPLLVFSLIFFLFSRQDRLHFDALRTIDQIIVSLRCVRSNGFVLLPLLIHLLMTYIFIVLVVVYDITDWYIDLLPRYNILHIDPNIWDNPHVNMNNDVYRMTNTLHIVYYHVLYYLKFFIMASISWLMIYRTKMRISELYFIWKSDLPHAEIMEILYPNKKVPPKSPEYWLLIGLLIVGILVTPLFFGLAYLGMSDIVSSLGNTDGIFWRVFNVHITDGIYENIKTYALLAHGASFSFLMGFLGVLICILAPAYIFILNKKGIEL